MPINALTSPDVYPVAVRSSRGEPVWELARLFPAQGEWTETQYLALDTNRLVELSDGCLEFLTMPTLYHQLLVGYLVKPLDAFVAARRLGVVLFAPLPVRLGPGKFREPDVMYFKPGRIHDVRHPPDGADLVMEVVSPGADARQHDFVTKRADYATAGIAEYWIVDPEQNDVTVLTLDGETYREHGVFRPGHDATSVMFPDFRVPVGPLFAAGQAPS